MNSETLMTLDDAVAEVLGQLTGLDLDYLPESDRYYSITRQLNRALRLNALEKEWSYYASTEVCGTTSVGDRDFYLRESIRPRIINDDAVRLVKDDTPVIWAYFLPRDAIHKYAGKRGLWVANLRNVMQWSRPILEGEEDLEIHVPVMREPRMFRLPARSEDPNEPIEEVPDETRQQELDFVYPDVVIMRAAYLYSLTDPVMQPRAQTLEAQYKDLMYQVIERDDRNTDSPYENEFWVPVANGISSATSGHMHPHSHVR